MVTCSNPACRLTINDGSAFCAYCGADQRALQNRLPIGHHEHEWYQGGYYCAQCGMMDPETSERIDGQARGKKFMLIGGGVFVLAIACMLISNAVDQANYDRLMKQREEWIKAGKPEGGDAHGETLEPNPLGAFTYVFGLAGAALTIYGMSQWISNRHNQWRVG